ncbi:Uncharacterised protein [Vibrio cholerae]|nr:Uncharacterised protein [Vibrio cholerae]
MRLCEFKTLTQYLFRCRWNLNFIYWCIITDIIREQGQE